MMKDSRAQRPVAIDLFAGAGGLSLGMEQAGFDVVASVELDPIHCAIHEFNFPRCEVVCASVATMTGSEIRERAGIGRRPVDVLVGGAPCQGFSMIGKRALDDPRNGLVRHFVRLAAELEARFFVFENVKGLTVGRHRQFLDEVIGEFDSNGYDVALPWRVLNAASFGVPQDRQRLFLIGARKGHALPVYPDPSFAMAGEQADALLPFGPTVADALDDLPDAEAYAELIESDKARVRLGKPSAYAARLRGIAEDAGDYSHCRDFDPAWMTSSLRADHTETSRERFLHARHGTTESISRFFKLDGGGVCNTLRAGTASDHGAFTSPRPIHHRHARCVTVREMARLHSYPDWFRFHATKWHGARQIGNSVPPLLGRAVGSTIIRAIGNMPFRPVGSIALGEESLLWMNMAGAATRYGVPHDTIPQRIRKVGIAAYQGAGK